MKDRLPKPRLRSQKVKVKQTMFNSFALSFRLESVDDKLRRGDLQMIFNGQDEMIQGEEMTETGYLILIDSLADAIRSLAEKAGEKTPLNANALKEGAISRLEVQRSAERVKLIGI